MGTLTFDVTVIEDPAIVVGFGKANHTEGQLDVHIPLQFYKDAVLICECWSFFQQISAKGLDDNRSVFRAVGNVADDTNDADWPLESIGIYDLGTGSLIQELNSTTIDTKAQMAAGPLTSSDQFVLYQDTGGFTTDLVGGTSYRMRYTGDFDEVRNADGLYQEWTDNTAYSSSELIYGKKSGENNKVWFGIVAIVAQVHGSFDDFVTSEGANLVEVGERKTPFFSIVQNGVETILDVNADKTNSYSLILPVFSKGITSNLTGGITSSF